MIYIPDERNAFNGKCSLVSERVQQTLTVGRKQRSRLVAIESCRSQIGSGALPLDLLPSHAVTIGGNALEKLARRLRGLPRPVIGRLAGDRLWLDCRCLEPADEAVFIAQLHLAGDTG